MNYRDATVMTGLNSTLGIGVTWRGGGGGTTFCSGVYGNYIIVSVQGCVTL